MKPVYDFKVDEADDIIIENDIVEENNFIKNVMRCAERRVSARFDDFPADNIAAGLERFLNSKITDFTKFSIEEAVRGALSNDSLMQPSEYDVFILDETEDGHLPVIIKLKVPYVAKGMESLASFKVLINSKNQRSYK